ncbi:MAG: ABC transporter permease [Beijerinckiaceae bacterium]
MPFWLLVLLTIITAATPLLLAATGEHVTEQSGVLNLGVEGMMIMGAAFAFAVAILTGSTPLAIAAGIGAGVTMAALFALFAVWLAANQVASGLALTILGVGTANLIGAGFVGMKRDTIPSLHVPGLSDIPILGKLVFGQDPFVYASLALAVAAGWWLARTRGGLTLRGVGENHASAHALGHDVRKVRTLAILFGGACAGLSGAYLSLVYTPFWSSDMTAGRGWIALAIVVFAGGRMWRLLLGAYLFGGMGVLQLHAQAGGVGLPSQLLSAVPYIATVLALMLLALREKGRQGAAGSLGQPFVPDR